MSDDTPIQRITRRLEEAGLDTERFIQCKQGSKKSVDHTQKVAADIDGQYGIYANATDGLAILDIDDYGEFDDTGGMAALAELPPTLEQKSAHDGTHRFYAVEPTPGGRLIAAVFEDEFGVKNPKPTWGEVRVANQYVVGAGSQLDGCDKDGCEECEKDDGGHYTLATDREIATIGADQLVEVLKADANYADVDDEPEDEERDAPTLDADDDEILEHALECDDKLNRLWNGDYSDYRGDDGEDRSAAESALAMKLAFWFQGDKSTVERMMDRARTKKWDERDDASYRDSILTAVDAQTEYYDPAKRDHRRPSDFDPEEVERGAEILRSQTGPENPAGELRHVDGKYGYNKRITDDEGGERYVFLPVTNFTLETVEYLKTDQEGELLTLRVHPRSHLEEPYDVRVHPTVFNEPHSFKEEVVRGRTTWFEPRKKPAQNVLNDLRETVGSQDAPRRTGTEFIGLAPEWDEWVAPTGTLTAEGWSDDPKAKYYAKGGDEDHETALGQKWRLTPEDHTDYDPDEIAHLCELLPRTRPTERGLPILGWFYAAPLKPLIHHWEGEFNLLQVYGDTGSGKTSTIQLYWQAFGADPDPFSASDTSFTIEKHMAESSGLPVWFDEYKPADIDDYRLKRLHRRLREVTRERVVAKGQADLSEVTFKLRAPVVFSGEQQINEVAVRRRTIMTNVTQAATLDGTETIAAFGEITGTPYEDADGQQHDPEGLDLSQHALAYYRFVLGLSEPELRHLWIDARERVSEILTELKIGSVDNTERQGLQTVVFGATVYRAFAKEMGADPDKLPTEAELKEAVAHVTDNIGYDGQRREHTDEFIEQMAQAAAEEYLEAGKHYRVVDSQKFGKEVLAVHMPTTYNAVKKFTREYNLEGEITALGRSDYNDSFANKAKTDGSYVLATNKKVRGLETGSKAVFIDPDLAADKLGEGFLLSAFGFVDDEEEAEEVRPMPIESTEPGYQTITAKVVKTDTDTPDGAPPFTGTLEDTTGVVDFITWMEGAFEDEREVGKCYRMESVRVGTDPDGAKQLELVRDVTDVTPIQPGVGFAPSEALDEDQADLDTAADGGQEYDQLKPRILQAAPRGTAFDAVEIANLIDEDPDDVRAELDRMHERGGEVIGYDDGTYEVN